MVAAEPFFVVIFVVLFVGDGIILFRVIIIAPCFLFGGFCVWFA